MRILTRRVAALAIVSTLTLAGCGGSDSDGEDSPSTDSTSAAPTSEAPDDAETEAPDEDAPNGGEIQGTGYSYSVPEGWETPEQQIPGTEQTDSFAADLTDADGFADNINVIRLDPAPVEDLDKLEDGLQAELEGAGSKQVEVGDRTEVDGAEAVTISSVQEQSGKQYLTEQVNAIRDGVSYVITFSFSDTVSDDDRDAVVDSILSSWKWSV